MIRRTPIRKRRLGGARRGPANVPVEMWRCPAYLRFLRYEGFCVVCGRRPQIGCDPAHGPVNGTSSKGPDAEAIPLCPEHHRRQHSMTWEQLEAETGIDRAAVAAEWWMKFKGRKR